MKYAPADLDRMRHAIGEIIYSKTIGGYSGYNPADRERQIEAQLLTYMANETTAEELLAHARQLLQDARARERRFQEAELAREAKRSKSFAAVDYCGKKRWWHL